MGVSAHPRFLTAQVSNLWCMFCSVSWRLRPHLPQWHLLLASFPCLSLFSTPYWCFLASYSKSTWHKHKPLCQALLLEEAKLRHFQPQNFHILMCPFLRCSVFEKAIYLWHCSAGSENTPLENISGSVTSSWTKIRLVRIKLFFSFWLWSK